jgi:hypothetical protein
MSGAHHRLRQLLEQYLKNVDFWLSIADLTDEEYYKKCPVPHRDAPRATKSELRIFKSEVTDLRDYISQCQHSGDELAIDMLIKMRRIATDAANDRHEIHLPMIERGRKALKDGRKAHERTYGTVEERNAKYEKLQEAIDAAHKKDPLATYGDLQKRVADKFDISKSTVEKRTINPKRKTK